MARAEAGEGPGLLGPPLLDLHRDRLGTGTRLRRTFAVSGYPREVGYAWLAPLLQASSGLDVALHVEPVAAELAARRLQRQRARFESSRRLERERGSLADPALAASAEDAHELADRLARGE